MDFINIPRLLSSKAALNKIPFLQQLVLIPKIEQQSLILFQEFKRILNDNNENKRLDLCALVLRLSSQFQSFSVKDLRNTVQHGTIRQFNMGDFIFKEGTPVNELFFVLSGSVKTTQNLIWKKLFSADSCSNMITIYESGTFVGGDVTSLGEEKYDGWSVATAPTEILVFGREWYPKNSQRNRHFNFNHGRRESNQQHKESNLDVFDDNSSPIVESVNQESSMTKSSDDTVTLFDTNSAADLILPIVDNGDTTIIDTLPKAAITTTHAITTTTPIINNSNNLKSTLPDKEINQLSSMKNKSLTTFRLDALSPLVSVNRKTNKNRKRMNWKKQLDSSTIPESFHRPTSPFVDGWSIEDGHLPNSFELEKAAAFVKISQRASTPRTIVNNERQNIHSREGNNKNNQNKKKNNSSRDINRVLRYAKRLIRGVAYLDAQHLSLWNLGFREKCARRWTRLQNMIENVCNDDAAKQRYKEINEKIQNFAQDAVTDASRLMQRQQLLQQQQQWRQSTAPLPMWYIGDRTLYSETQWLLRTEQSNSRMIKDTLHEIWKTCVTNINSGEQSKDCDDLSPGDFYCVIQSAVSCSIYFSFFLSF